MSLTPIPARMLHDTAVVRVVTGMDRYQNKTYQEFRVSHVHMQDDINVVKAVNNTEVQLRGVLFVDCRRSTPNLDYHALQEQSLAAGDTMRVQVYDASGVLTGDYAVLTVEGLPDVPATRVHHWELGVV